MLEFLYDDGATIADNILNKSENATLLLLVKIGRKAFYISISFL